MPGEIKQERGNISQFILGFFFGVIVFGVIAAVATLYLQGHHYCATSRFSTGVSNCIPVFEFAFLRTASWGPSIVLSLISPTLHMSQLQWQILSGGLFGIVSAALFLFASRRSPAEVFLVVYLLVTVLTGFLIWAIMI